MINGRFTSGFYKKMNLKELISESKEEYINFAIKLGLDIDFRKECENKIKEKKLCLFNDNESIEEWKNMLIELYNDKY
jgi:predicted O-linked N-acetylglucosamine transferase (SPINDLY family)